MYFDQISICTQKLKSISYLLVVGVTVPISQGSRCWFSSGFLQIKESILRPTKIKKKEMKKEMKKNEERKQGLPEFQI